MKTAKLPCLVDEFEKALATNTFNELLKKINRPQDFNKFMEECHEMQLRIEREQALI